MKWWHNSAGDAFEIMPKLLQKVRPLIPLLDPTVKEWSVSARLMWWLTCFWLSIGILVLFSASYHHGQVEQQDGLYYFVKQLIAIFIGLVLFGWVVRTPLRKIISIAPWGLIFVLGLVWLTLVPGLGKGALGANRWLGVGPIQIQPSDVIKPFLVIQAAKLFGQWERWPLRTKSVGLVIFALVLLGILRQPNLSTTALCGITLWLIACAAGIAKRYLVGTAIGGVGVAMISLALQTYQRRRMLSFLNPWADPMDSGFQLIQSLYAIGSGGLLGSGYGRSMQKLGYLPIQDTDFIFSVYAEEFGYLGSITLILMVMAYATIGLGIAYQAKNMVHRLIALGAMTFIVLQSIFNIGVAAGALPTTGLPLPFFSYGGTSMLASLMMSALLIRVARESDEEKVVSFNRQPPPSTWPFCMFVSFYQLEQFANQLVNNQLTQITPLSIGIIFGAGLLTSLTPCTLSMLPITIGYIGGYADRSKWQAAQQSAWFCLGLATTLAGMGVVAAGLGRIYGQIGWGLPIIVSVLAIIMGLNLLEVISIRLPSWGDSDWIGQDWPEGVRAYLLGLTFGLVASPCSTPVLATLLAWVASTRNIGLGQYYCCLILLAMSRRWLLPGLLRPALKAYWVCGSGRPGLPPLVVSCWLGLGRFRCWPGCRFSDFG